MLRSRRLEAVVLRGVRFLSVQKLLEVLGGAVSQNAESTDQLHLIIAAFRLKLCRTQVFQAYNSNIFPCMFKPVGPKQCGMWEVHHSLLTGVGAGPQPFTTHLLQVLDG